MPIKQLAHPTINKNKIFKAPLSLAIIEKTRMLTLGICLLGI